MTSYVMTKPVAAVFAVALYFIAIWFVCFLNEEAILRDAVVGVAFVAALYSVVFLPAALCAAAAVALDRLQSADRAKLAGIFAVALAAFLETWFWASQRPSLGPIVMRLGMLPAIVGNAALILAYFGIALHFAKRRPASGGPAV